MRRAPAAAAVLLAGLVLLLVAPDAAGAAVQGVADGTGILEPFWQRLLRGTLSLSVLLGVLWVFSARRRRIDWPLVA